MWSLQNDITYVKPDVTYVKPISNFPEKKKQKKQQQVNKNKLWSVQ